MANANVNANGNVADPRWSGPEIRRLKLGLAMNEWLEIEHGGVACRLRVVACHGGHARLEIDGPLSFAFVRATAGAKVPKPGTARRGATR
jgi:hypothetical protein